MPLSIDLLHGDCPSSDQTVFLKSSLPKQRGVFPELFNYTDDLKALFIPHFISSEDALFKNALGMCFIRSIPWHEDKLKNVLAPISHPPNYSDNDFVIVLSREISLSSNAIEISFTVGHEIRHIHQYVFFRDAFFKNSLLHDYICLSIPSFNRNTLPHEQDAIRAGKRTAIASSSKTAVDEYISEKMQSDANSRQYWESIELIDIFSEYDFVKETELLWLRHKDDLEAFMLGSTELSLKYQYYNSFKR